MCSMCVQWASWRNAADPGGNDGADTTNYTCQGGWLPGVCFHSSSRSQLLTSCRPLHCTARFQSGRGGGGDGHFQCHTFRAFCVFQRTKQRKAFQNRGGKNVVVEWRVGAGIE